MNRRAFLAPAKTEALPDTRVPLPDSSYNAYGQPLTAEQVRHIFRRTGFGARPARVNEWVGSTASALVESLMTEASSQPLPPEPDWAFTWDVNINLPRVRVLYRDWVELLFQRGLREKLTLFWHDHFVTEYANQPIYTFRYLNRCRKHAMGNFVDFVHEIGRDQEMLRYLNGKDNKVGNPNENYGRELFELFTMGRIDKDGVLNYTEQDIVEASRALTGWWVDPDANIGRFANSQHDSGQKTVFGVTENIDYDRLHEIIFEQRGRQTAEYICSKIYRYFVYEKTNWKIVGDMADAFQANNYDLRPVLARLFKSQHFLQSAAVAARLKSPIEMFIMQMTEADYVPSGHTNWQGSWKFIYQSCAWNLGQRLLSPTDVSGWSGFRDWVSSSTLSQRVQRGTVLLTGSWSGFEMPRQNLVPWAKAVSSSWSDPDIIVDDIMQHVFSCPIEPIERGRLIEAFKNGIPETEFENGLWDLDRVEAPDQLIALMTEIYALPEYQLM